MRFELTKEFLELTQNAVRQENSAWIQENIYVLHDADISVIINELDLEDAAALYNKLDNDTQGDVLPEIDVDIRKFIIKAYSPKEIAGQLENLDSDDAADLIGDLSQDEIEEVISHITDNEAADDIVDLLNYEDDTAGGLMQKEFIKARLNWPVNRCIVELRRQAEDVEKVFTIYVVDDADKLVGILSLKRLLFASPQTKIQDLFQDKNVITVKTSDDDEEVARVMGKI